MVLNFRTAFLKRKIKIKFLLASLKTLILNVVPEAASEFMSSFSSLPLVDFRLCFSAIGNFFQCIYHSQLPEQFAFLYASCMHAEGQNCPCMVSKEDYGRNFQNP